MKQTARRSDRKSRRSKINPGETRETPPQLLVGTTPQRPDTEHHLSTSDRRIPQWRHYANAAGLRRSTTPDALIIMITRVRCSDQCAARCRYYLSKIDELEKTINDKATPRCTVLRTTHCCGSPLLPDCAVPIAISLSIGFTDIERSAPRSAAQRAQLAR